MTTRRSFLSFLFVAAVVTPSAVAGVPTTMPAEAEGLPPFRYPRGVVVEAEGICDPGHTHTTICDPTHVHGITPALLMTLMISTGEKLVPFYSDEGQEVARSIAVNLRSDGTIRHRQHHWPR